MTAPLLTDDELAAFRASKARGECYFTELDARRQMLTATTDADGVAAYRKFLRAWRPDNGPQ